jgi:hypothetical protein
MATPTTSDFLVVPINGTDLIAFYRGSNISRPLYLSYSNFLAILTQAISGGTNILLQTNNVDNPAQNVLNLIEGTGIDITATAGGVTISANSGTSFITAISDTSEIDLTVTSSTLSAALTTTGVTPGLYGTGTTVPQITVDSKGRITGVTNVAITSGAGTVTSVGVNAGTGITATISGTATINPTINITNSAPDQTVALTGGATIGISGTYPAFTIRTNVSTNQRLLGRFTAGSGAYEEIQIGANLTLSGGTLSATGGGGGAVASVSGTTNRISVSPTTGAVVVDIDANYVGQSTITTLGTIGTGTWQGTTIGTTYGGTGLTSIGTTLQLLRVNTAATALEYFTPTYLTSAVTSVALSMPAAFTVTGSPITGAGTLAVTGAGTTSQYVRGDGSLATYNPGTGGGGASVNYYLNGSVNQTPTIGGLTYKQMSKTPVIGAGTDFTINADGYIQSFITDAGTPNQLLIPGGNWIFEMWFSASSGGGSPKFYVDVCTFDGTTLTTIGTSSATPENITGGTAIDLYTTAVAVPQTTLALTDRIAIRVYVIHSSKTIKLHTEDSHLCEVITTFSTGITALNGLTDQVQNFATPGTTGTAPSWSSVSPNHTLNIPLASTASVTAGLLSNTDYTTFSGKLSPTLNNANIFVGNVSNVATGVAMSGDTTITNAGAVTIANNAVTYAKMQNASAIKKLLGSNDASASITEITLGTNLTMVGNTLNASGGGGGGITELTTDVTTPAASSGVTVATLKANLKIGSFGVTVDGVSSVIQVGQTGFVVMPYAGTITGWSITTNAVGSIQFDVWKDALIDTIPTVADSIVGGVYPTLTTAQLATSTSVGAWTTAFSAGHVFGFYVNSVSSTVKNATLTIRCTKS